MRENSDTYIDVINNVSSFSKIREIRINLTQFANFPVPLRQANFSYSNSGTACVNSQRAFKVAPLARSATLRRPFGATEFRL